MTDTQDNLKSCESIQKQYDQLQYNYDRTVEEYNKYNELTVTLTKENLELTEQIDILKTRLTNCEKFFKELGKLLNVQVGNAYWEMAFVHEIKELKEEVKKLKKYKNLFEKAKEYKQKTDKWAEACLKENEDLKDSLKRTVCQAECFKHKEAEKYKSALQYIRHTINWNDLTDEQIDKICKI